MINFFYFFLLSLIKEYKQRPKYGQLMLQPFFIQSREQPVDVAGWYKDVTTAAIEKQRRWLNMYLVFFSFIFYHSFVSRSINFFLFFVPSGIYLVCLFKNSSSFQRVHITFFLFVLFFSFFFCVICTWLWSEGVFMKTKKIKKMNNRMSFQAILHHSEINAIYFQVILCIRK